MPITLDLLRHGAAEASHPGGDAERALTPDGRDAIRRLGVALAAAGWRPDAVFASPYRRARETAELVLRAAGRPAIIETLDALVPEAEPGDCLAAIDRADLRDAHLLLVTHQPLVSRLARQLTSQAIGFAPGDRVRVALPDGLRGAGFVVEG